MTVHTPLSVVDIQRSYKNWALHYDYSFALLGRHYLKKVIRQFNQDATGDVLDVGVGTGLSLPYFSRDLRVTGIDLSEEMMARARARVARHHLSHVNNLLIMDANNLAFDDHQFDAVIANFVMSVVPNPAQVMHEINRVCKPGGTVYLFNHFKSESGRPLMSGLESIMAPISRKIGFHSDCNRASLQLEDTKFTIHEIRQMGPFDMFTLMKLQKAL